MKKLLRTFIYGYETSGERGAALVMALMFLLILTLLGMASVMTSGTEVMISRNDRLNKLALNYANAGMQAAMCRIDKGDIGSTLSAVDVMNTPGEKSKTWGPFYADQVGITDMNFKVTVVYKFEDTLHQDSDGNPNDGEITAYSQDEHYSKSPFATFNTAMPVFTVTSIGWVGGAAHDPTSGTATATVTVDVTKDTLNIYAPAALYSNGCISESGAATISGGTMPGYQTPCTTSSFHNAPTGAAPVTGPGAFVNMTGTSGNRTPYIGVDLNTLRSMAQAKGNYYKYNGSTWSPASGPIFPMGDSTAPGIFFIDLPAGQDYKINGNSQGYGLLVVNGNLTINGTMNWYGLTYVTGDLNTIGTAAVNGGTMVGGADTTSVGGHSSLTYDKSQLDNLKNKYFTTKILNWTRSYN